MYMIHPLSSEALRYMKGKAKILVLVAEIILLLIKFLAELLE